jgi:hypothetical protein
VTFHQTQDQDYLDLCISRAQNEYLNWVEQFLDLIEQNVKLESGLSLNDIGCCVGQFWKGLARRALGISYHGYDIEDTYLREARRIFPELSDRVHYLDIATTKPAVADISVVSATLEHLDSLSPGIDHFLTATKTLAIVRTFLGESSEHGSYKKPKALQAYAVNQYSFVELLEAFAKYGFTTTVVRDRNTDSLPKYIGPGLVRTQYIVVGKKLND